MNLSVTLDVQTISRDVKSTSLSIQEYLKQRMGEYKHSGERCLFLPSMLSLSECFDCSAVEVYQALDALKRSGCDLFINGFDRPITLWYPERIA